MASELLSVAIGAGAVIAGGLLTGVYPHLRDWRESPRLVLDYLDDEAHRTEATWQEGDRQITQKYIRARLQNTGRRVARSCRVFLVEIGEVYHGGVKPTNFYDPEALCWPGSPRAAEPRDIPNGINQYVDVVSVRMNETGWRFHAPRLYASQSSLKDYKGTYRLKLVATADNAKPYIYEIDIQYNGEWGSLRAWASPKE